MSSEPQVEVLANDRNLTGESPMYSPAENAIYWLDGRRQQVYQLLLGSGKRDHWDTPSKVNAVVLRRSGGLVSAMKDGVYTLDMASGTWSPLVVTEPDEPGNRANDGKVDRAGRFWYGTMEDDGKTPTGRYYRIEADRSFAAVDGGYSIPNGPCWSPDAKRMYMADSKLGTIYAWDFDLASGNATNKRTFVQIDPKAAVPDGATTDAEGYLWCAQPGSYSVVRYAPDGSEHSRLRLPVKRPTSVMLGGDDFRTLFITTGSRGLSEEELAAQPLAGALLAVRVDVPGMAEPEYAG